VTDQTAAPSAESATEPTRRSSPVGRTLMWVGIGLGIAGVSAALGLVVVRMALRGDAAPAADETAERIQSLIDEANRLIKTLDEKKQS
jgi:hypothetical protein